MARPKGSGSEYVVPSKGELRRLVCDVCPVIVDLKLKPEDTLWPQHKCHATHKPAPFNRATNVPTPPVRDWNEWPQSVLE